MGLSPSIGVIIPNYYLVYPLLMTIIIPKISTIPGDENRSRSIIGQPSAGTRRCRVLQASHASIPVYQLLVPQVVEWLVNGW